MVFVMCMLAGVLVCARKKAMHEDEFYSYYSSNRSYGLIAEGEVSRDDVLRELEVVPGEGFNFGLVREVQSWDVHPPIYYFALHFICSLSAGTFSMWQGLGFNLFCLAACLGLMKLLGGLIMPEDPLVVDLCIVAWGLSAATLTGVSFIRMYVLLTAWILAVTCLHVSRINETPDQHSPGFWVLLWTLTFLGFMTHYYFLVWLVALGGTWNACVILRTRSVRTSLIYVAVEMSCAVACYLFYPAFPAQMFKGQRGAQATGNFLDLSNTWERLRFFGEKVNRVGFGGGLWVLIGFVVVLMLLARDKRDGIRPKMARWNAEDVPALNVREPCDDDQMIMAGRRTYLLLLPLLLYFCIVSKTALMLGDSSIRYHVPVLGIAYILIGHLCSSRIRLAAPAKSPDPDEATDYGRMGTLVGVIVMAVMTAVNLVADFGGRISFLYPERAEHVRMLEEWRDAEVIYAYPAGQSWIMWAEATELLGFDKVEYVTADDLIMAGLNAGEDAAHDKGDVKDDDQAPDGDLGRTDIGSKAGDHSGGVILYADASADTDLLIKMMLQAHPELTGSRFLFSDDYTVTYAFDRHWP